MRNSTRKKVGTEFSESVEQQRLNLGMIAEAIGVKLKTLSTFKTNYREMPAEIAVKLSGYLGDPLFNAQMGAKYFNTIAMLVVKSWKIDEAENPYETSANQRKEERDRITLEELLEVKMHDGKDTEYGKKYLKEYIEEISSEMRDLYTKGNRFGIDVDGMIAEYNKAS